MQFDRPGIRQIREELNTLLADWAKKNNVSVEVGSATFMPGQNATFKVSVATTVKTATGTIAMDSEAIDFTRSARQFGLEPSDLNKKFIFRGNEYTITGSAPRAWKAPILATRSDGKKFKFPAPTVVMALGKKPTKDAMTIGAGDVAELLEGLR